MSAAEKPNLDDVTKESETVEQQRQRIELETAVLMEELPIASADRRRTISLRIVELGDEYAALQPPSPSLLSDIERLSAEAEVKLGDLDAAAEAAFPNIYDEEMARLRAAAEQIEAELQTAEPGLADELEERLAEVGLEYARVLSSKMAVENDGPELPGLFD